VAGGLTDSAFTSDINDSSTGYYSPYTPPYYDGESWVLLTYRPTGSVAYKPTLEDIINNITASYLRYEFNSGTLATSSAAPLSYGYFNLNSMQASASLNLFNIVEVDETSLNNISDNATVVKGSKVWAIQTKFETPILNFASTQNVSAIDSGSQANATYGMWHQYGTVTNEKNGIFLQITDVPDNYIRYGGESDERRSVPTGRNINLTASLADIVGFSKDEVRLGQVSNEKTIKEAIVAIPFVTKEDERKYFEFGSLAKEYVNFLKSEQSSVSSFSKLTEVPETVVNQVSLMQEYVIPPSLDFMKNDLIDPIAMYIFEFSYTLTQDDLVNIWQGVMPQISVNFAEQSQEITHELSTNLGSSELLTRFDLTDNLQWLVFKVKKKAKNNYNNKLLQSVKTTSTFNKVKALQSLGKAKINTFDNTEELDYSYNWPYDFFSLVEVAKINAKIDFMSQTVSSVADISSIGGLDVELQGPSIALNSNSFSKETSSKLLDIEKSDVASSGLSNIKTADSKSTSPIKIIAPTTTKNIKKT
jgi:hypothetical protein